jgi:hypothetical protein
MTRAMPPSLQFGFGPVGSDSALNELRRGFERRMRRSLSTLGRLEHFLERQPINL